MGHGGWPHLLVQSRPVTAVGGAAGRRGARTGDAAGPGPGGFGGPGSGVVRVLQTPDEGHRFQSGEVLVAPMTSPDWVPTMRRAAAVVTDGGGMTCHAAIVSRELGVPAVVGARNATTVLRDGELVTVDGAQGTVTEGAVAPPLSRRPRRRRRNRPAPGGRARWRPGSTSTWPSPTTPKRWRPSRSTASACCEPSSWSPTRWGVHPRRLLERGDEKTFVDDMAKSLLRITRAFEPRPVVYRSIDFRSNEFSNLEGGDKFEPHEENPMIGYRGCYRYVREPDLFRLELDVLAHVLEETPNIVLMIPFVRTAWELEACLEVVDASPVAGSLPVWVMAEVPSVAYWIPTYAGMGINGVSIGSNDLTQLMLGVDRDSQICADVFDEADPAVLDAIGRIIGGASPRASRRRCAVRPLRTGRPSPSFSSVRASPRSR